MNWLPFLLVMLNGFFPIENLVESLDGELIIRSTWSVMLCISLYFCISVKRLTVILICEFLSIAYNFAIALGYYFADKDLAALYEPLMVFLFFIELYCTLPWRTRRDSRDTGSDSNYLRGRASRPHDMAISSQMPEALCKR